MSYVEQANGILRSRWEPGGCAGCYGSGVFDHGAGEGHHDGPCRPWRDDNTPPHRTCPCLRCGGGGIAPASRAAILAVLALGAEHDAVISRTIPS